MYKIPSCIDGYEGFMGKCTPCAIGYNVSSSAYLMVTNGSPPPPLKCEPCPLGTFNSEMATGSCSKAPSGYYVAVLGSTETQACPTNAVCDGMVGGIYAVEVRPVTKHSAGVGIERRRNRHMSV